MTNFPFWLVPWTLASAALAVSVATVMTGRTRFNAGRVGLWILFALMALGMVIWAATA